MRATSVSSASSNELAEISDTDEGSTGPEPAGTDDDPAYDDWCPNPRKRTARHRLRWPFRRMFDEVQMTLSHATVPTMSSVFGQGRTRRRGRRYAWAAAQRVTHDPFIW